MTYSRPEDLGYSAWLDEQCKNLGIRNYQFMDARGKEHMICMVKWESATGRNDTPRWTPEHSSCWGDPITLPGGTVICQRHINGCPS